MHILEHIGNWLYHICGISGTGAWYAFWSGFGSDIGEVAIFGAIIGVYQHHKCKSCLRPAKHPVEGTPYRTCHHHSTDADHRRLHEKHATDHPEQHAFLNKSSDT